MTALWPPFNALAENVFEAFSEVVLDGVQELAEAKHIALPEGVANSLTENIADAMDLPDPLRFMRDEPAARFRVLSKTCQLLDEYIAERFMDIYVGKFGCPTSHSATLHGIRAIRHLLPRYDRDDMGVWPALTLASLLPHLETRTGDLFTRWPNGCSVTYHRGLLLDSPSTEGPAVQFFHPDGRQEFEYWKNGMLHRDATDGPAIIHRRGDAGPVSLEEYYASGKLHRDGGPATISYCEHTGRMLSCTYFRHGELHREDGEAAVIFGMNGQVISEFWYKDGIPHRVCAPAMIERSEAGDVTYEAYWQDGVQTSTTINTFGVYDGH